MGVVHEYRIILLLGFLILGCTVSQGSSVAGLARANELVGDFGGAMGASGARLDADLDRSFGEVGFHYDRGRDVLIGRVYVADARIKNRPQEVREKYREVARALNDPAIGGMFEQGGGHFVLDEDKEMYFLVRAFPVATTDSRVFRREMEDLMNLGATWTMRWFYRVTNIAHGEEPPPKTRVTRDNDTD